MVSQNLLRNSFWRAVLLGFGALVAVCNIASGQSWVTQYSGGRNVLGIKAVNENFVWAGATSCAFFRTTDGNTWKDRVVTGATGVDFYSVAPIDQDTAYLAGRASSGASDGRIYKTTDGGQNWTQQYRNTKTGAAFFGIAFWDRDNGIAFSDPVEGGFLIVTTANGGTTWEEVPKANIPPPLAGELGGLRYNGAAMALEGTSNAWFGTSYASPDRIFRTRDKGRTWTVANTPFPTGGSLGWGVRRIAFIDSLNGYAVGGLINTDFSGAGNLGRTTDGGNNWNVVTSATALLPYNVVYVPGMGDSGLVVTGGSGSYYSQDGGTTWKKIDSGLYVGVTFASPTAGWATGGLYESRILKFNGNLATAVAERESGAPQAFELAQNYPNPFNPGTHIKFHVPATSSVRLEVFNITGQHIATLLEEKRAAGEHELSWDGRNDLGQPVPSGVYLLSIRAGEFTQARKMLLTR
jgi:photosystem II stability/assembly factor-like uncharacterized protein